MAALQTLSLQGWRIEIVHDADGFYIAARKDGVLRIGFDENSLMQAAWNLQNKIEA